jgi:hypothetical protein
LKDFFVGILGVKMLTLQMVFDELTQPAPRKTTDEVKSTIWSFNELLQTEPTFLDPTPLLKACVFPIRYANGTVTLSSATTEFAIADREYLDLRFRGLIKLLDYSMEDVRHLKPFFEWANLTHRYLSIAVRETTFVEHGKTRPITAPNRDLKRKAHALLRYVSQAYINDTFKTNGILRVAATFRSPRYQLDATGLYRSFRMLDVVETNAMASTLAISQDGKLAEVKESIGDMHIQEDGSNLTIYVPMDKKAQEFCFCSHLPAKLAGWLMRAPNTHIPEPIDNAMVTSLTTLLTVGPSVVDLVLDHQGIIGIPLSDEDHNVDKALDSDLDSDSDSDQKSTLGSTLPATTEGADDSGNDAVALSQEPPSPTHHISARLQNLVPTRHVLRDVPASEHDLRPRPDEAPYRKLLDKVLIAARANVFPSKGTFDMSSLSSSLPAEVDAAGFDDFESSEFGLMSGLNTKAERDRKVGAAGELYVSCLPP